MSAPVQLCSGLLVLKVVAPPFAFFAMGWFAGPRKGVLLFNLFGSRLMLASNIDIGSGSHVSLSISDSEPDSLPDKLCNSGTSGVIFCLPCPPSRNGFGTCIQSSADGLDWLRLCDKVVQYCCDGLTKGVNCVCWAWCHGCGVAICSLLIRLMMLGSRSCVTDMAQSLGTASLGMCPNLRWHVAQCGHFYSSTSA